MKIFKPPTLLRGMKYGVAWRGWISANEELWWHQYCAFSVGSEDMKAGKVTTFSRSANPPR
jgi:hypothetical protein